MYICVCYKLNQDRVEEILRSGVSPGKVFEAIGREVKCGLCGPFITDIYREISKEKQGGKRKG
jgi:bacterioferritin-associated ferredoxin